jgi:hypothetical protein
MMVQFSLLLSIVQATLVFCRLTNWVESNVYDSILPSGVRIFRANVVDNTALGAWLVTADVQSFKQSKGWEFQTFLSKNMTSHLSTVRQFSSDYDALIATNGGFFGSSNGVGMSYSFAAGGYNKYSANIPSLSRSGVSYFPTRCAFGVDKTHSFDAFWIYDIPNSNSSWAYSKPSPNKQGTSPQPVPNATFPTAATMWSVEAGVGGGPMLVFEGANVAL